MNQAGLPAASSTDSSSLLGPLFFDLLQIFDKIGFAFEQAKDCVGCFTLDYLSALPPNHNLRPLAQKLLELRSVGNPHVPVILSKAGIQLLLD